MRMVLSQTEPKTRPVAEGGDGQLGDRDHHLEVGVGDLVGDRALPGCRSGADLDVDNGTAPVPFW